MKYTCALIARLLHRLLRRQTPHKHQQPRQMLLRRQMLQLVSHQRDLLAMLQQLLLQALQQLQQRHLHTYALVLTTVTHQMKHSKFCKCQRLYKNCRTICEYNTHGYIDVSFTDGTQTLNVLTTTNQAAGMETCMLRRDGGKLLYVDGSEQTGGTLLAMSAEHLTEGTGMHITGDDLVTGSLIKLSSKSTNVTNGILRMDTNDVRSGKLVSIEANKLEDGSAIDISNDGSSLSTGSLIKLSSKSTNVTNGILRMDTT